MSALKAEKKELMRGKGQAPSDVFTAMLGLSLLVLLGTVGFVCWQCYTMYGSFWEIARP